MSPSVKAVIPLEGYRLSVEFDNGESGIIVMTQYLNFGVFKRLQDRDEFRKVHVSFDTVEWDAGVDLDPDFVYSKCEILKQGN